MLLYWASSAIFLGENHFQPLFAYQNPLHSLSPPENSHTIIFVKCWLKCRRPFRQGLSFFTTRVKTRFLYKEKNTSLRQSGNTRGVIVWIIESKFISVWWRKRVYSVWSMKLSRFPFSFITTSIAFSTNCLTSSYNKVHWRV